MKKAGRERCPGQIAPEPARALRSMCVRTDEGSARTGGGTPGQILGTISVRASIRAGRFSFDDNRVRIHPYPQGSPGWLWLAVAGCWDADALQAVRRTLEGGRTTRNCHGRNLGFFRMIGASRRSSIIRRGWAVFGAE